ncbi:MAG TPA: L,D-transpeptidase family protein [Streptosporangiaceae bacterium]|nr:L,D-transpeptidase family protein [Streptosporangiaceae bacterium]
MRRLWMSALLAPVLALAVPAVAMATPSVPAERTAPAAAQTSLQLGQHGLSVRQLQRRLAALKYYPGAIDGSFSTNTLEAVWAFQEVQGLPGEDFVSAAMQRALSHPRAPRVLDRAAGPNRIEVNLHTEVLVLYRHNRIQLISHVSSGGGYYYCSPGGGCGVAITPTGNFSTRVFLPGWVVVPLGEMYNPVFFIGTAFAIHGDTDVPLAPVSHGCVRIPMDIAAFFHTLVKIPGEPVIIRR